jgi:glutamate-1-semialdehyde 2,1-aminomutase
LVFDETITGFRLALGGGQEHFGVQPDLATFAKALGNGFPVAAVVGRADLMDMCVSAGVVHGGTYNSQSASMAATVATLEAVSSPGFYEGLEDHSERLMEAIRRILHDASIPAVVTGFPSVFHVAFGLEEPARDFRDLTRVDRKRYVAFTTALLRRGARVLERGIWFLSSEHDEDTLEATVHAAGEAAKDLAGY